MDREFHSIAGQLWHCCRPLAAAMGLSLAAGSAVASGQDLKVATAEASRPTLEASVVDDRLTLRAEGAPLVDVLRAIGRAGSFGVVLRGKLAEPVNQSFADAPLEDALRQLVGAHLLVMVHGAPDQTGAGLAEIRVTAKRTLASPEAAAPNVSPVVPPAAPEEDATDPIYRQEAYRQAVLDYMPPTKDDLLVELDEPDRAARITTVPKVAGLQPSEAIDVISHVFSNDDDAAVRSRAVAALTRLDGPGARGLLRERALGDDDPGLRMQALNALASSRKERAVNVIGQALRQDPEPEVRMSALRALGRVGGDWARRSLERAARDPDLQISLAAEDALAAWPED